MEALTSGTEIERIANKFVTPSRGGRLHYHCIMRKIWPELMPRKVTLSVVSTDPSSTAKCAGVQLLSKVVVSVTKVANYMPSVYDPLITTSLGDEAGTLFVLETSQTSENR